MMLRRLFFLFFILTGVAFAQGNLDVDSPVINQLTTSMSSRYAQLKPYYVSGAIGLANDGNVVLRDASVVPLAQRQAANRLAAAENEDRAALYREIARVNGNPAWEKDIRTTFAQRWIDRAPAGWWVQNATGAWQQKK
ncbi:MAG: YdbL family protein [Georgfuchsia sp.]